MSVHVGPEKPSKQYYKSAKIEHQSENAAMNVVKLEQLCAVIVAAGLVAGNFLLFTPWRNGRDPREKNIQKPIPQAEISHDQEKQ